MAGVGGGWGRRHNASTIERPPPYWQVRIQKMGRGTIACCNENFLTQAHNKAEYVPLPHSPYRYELLASRVNSHMDKCVPPP